MMAASLPRQLALHLPHAESHAREDFLEGGANRAALMLIDVWPDWPQRAALLLGPEGSGKSHLASIWAEASGARITAARALDVASVPSSLATGALVVEDLALGEFDERALFHLLNLAKQEESFLLMTARSAPTNWTLQLPDLASRLRALPVVSLSAPDDVLLRAVIVKLAADRQMALDDGVVGYLASRIERSFSAARQAVVRLDEEGLRLGRPASRVLAVEVVRDLLP
jgi:chromosomal replication initiation ATPase DnaA